MVKLSEVVILAMKPQYLDDAIKSFESVPTHQLFISILAGISIETLNGVSSKNQIISCSEQFIYSGINKPPPRT